METLFKTLVGCSLAGILAAGCGGTGGTTQTQTTGTNPTDSTANATRQVAAQLAIADTGLETIFQYAQPLQLTTTETVLTQPLAEGDTSRIYKIMSTTDFANYIAMLKATKRLRYDAWEMNDVLYDEFAGADVDKPISDKSIISRNILNERELKYFRMWFVLTVKENAVYVKDAYDKIHKKLNEICRDCIPLQAAQIEQLQDKLKKQPNNYGILDVLTTQQMTSYGM